MRVRRAPPVLLLAGLAAVPDLAAAAEEARRAVPGRVVRAAVGARPNLLGFLPAARAVLPAAVRPVRISGEKDCPEGRRSGGLQCINAV